MSQLSGFNAIVTLMHRIKDTGREYPRVRLAIADDKPLMLTVAGARSRTPGHVMLTDGAAYPNNVYYGSITLAGDYIPSAAARAMPQDIKAPFWAILQRMKAGEAEKVFSEYGHKFGVCCMCGRELSNPESVEMGIGPICRERAF